jgi:hypothetical protein
MRRTNLRWPTDSAAASRRHGGIYGVSAGIRRLGLTSGGDSDIFAAGPPRCTVSRSTWGSAAIPLQQPKRAPSGATCCGKSCFHPAKTGHSGPSMECSQRPCWVQEHVVGATGLEPATFWSQTRRSTKLSYAPNIVLAAASTHLGRSAGSSLRYPTPTVCVCSPPNFSLPRWDQN